MMRRALFLSLIAHAGFLAVAGWRLGSVATPVGPADAGDVSAFSSENTGSFLLVETIPVEPPVSLSSQPNLIPPEPSVQIQSLMLDAWPAAPIAIPEIAEATLRGMQLALEVLPDPESQTAHRSGLKPAGSSNVSGRLSESKHAGTPDSGDGGGGSGCVPPQFRIRYKPAYPAEARAQRLEGIVLLLVSVDANGRVTDASVCRGCGHTMLDRAALDAVRSWRFEPARQNGNAVSAQVEIPVRFRFEEKRRSRA